MIIVIVIIYDNVNNVNDYRFASEGFAFQDLDQEAFVDNIKNCWRCFKHI